MTRPGVVGKALFVRHQVADKDPYGIGTPLASFHFSLYIKQILDKKHKIPFVAYTLISYV
jgi:hypothetical protein